MALRWFGTLVAAVVVLAPTPVARAADDGCWQLIDRALQHSAGSPHARFITYGEHFTVFADGIPLENIGSTIVYRDDGLAYVADERWVHPFLSRFLEPGPPVLGPYRDSRPGWLAADTMVTALPVIAHVHAYPKETCADDGPATVDGKPFVHLTVGHELSERPGLRDIWIDPQAYDIGRVVVRGPLHFYVRDGFKDELTDYTVDLERVAQYTVVRRVTWQYREREYSQWTDLSAEYDFRDYNFSDVPPPGTMQAELAM